MIFFLLSLRFPAAAAAVLQWKQRDRGVFQKVHALSHCRNRLSLGIPPVNRPCLYLEGLAQDQGLGHLSSGLIDNAADGSPRYSHFQGSLLMIFSLIVAKPERLHFVETQANFLQSREGDAPGLEI